MLKAGQKLAHFEVLSKLGEGGMGAVYLALDTKLNRRVALKVLTGELFDDVTRLERFKREARTAAQISNAYVMSTFDIGCDPDAETKADINYIVLEFVEGRPLNEYLREERPALAAQVRLAEKIASGLAAAHKLNIVHRDIKPDNIIIDDSGDPKILDFGLAKPLEPVFADPDSDSTRTVSEELTRAGKIMGTVSYMSPEQVRGDKVDTRSDIFAFGILLYRMVTGESPFAGPSQVETMAKILESTFEPPRARNESIPPELERIISKCLQKDPEERYQSSRDLVVDLRNVRRQFDSGLSETITDTGLTTRLSSRRPRLLRRAGILIAVVAVLLVVLKFANDDQSQPVTKGLQAKSNSLAIIGFENKTGDTGLNWLETGLPEIMLTDLAQIQEVSIISQQRILDCFDAEVKKSHTYEQCVRAAESLGATRLLSGSFYKLGQKIRIDARLEDIGTGDIVLAEKVIGDDAFELVDSLTAKIALALNLRQTGDLQNLASSPEAFKEYHIGMEYFGANEYDSAIAKFEEAIAIDSSFAMPYMRIGMAHTFAGRNAVGARYFAMAQERQDRLPARDRRLLDAYIDTWVRQEFERAFTKLETLVADYPDDAEIRSIYALFIDGFRGDTTAAYAQLDTVLATYPTFAFALEQYATLLRFHGNLDRAAYYTVRLLETYPGAVSPLIRLVLIRQRQGRWDEALSLSQELQVQHPDDPRPLYRLISVSLHMRRFGAARDYTERLRQLQPDDPYNLMDYYRYLAQIDTWEGKFQSSMENRRQLLNQARQTGDSTQIWGVLNAMADYFLRFEEIDSMLIYEKEAFGWARRTERISYPLRLISTDPAYEPEVRPIMAEVMEDFRARTPREIWPLGEALEKVFDGLASLDTALLIVGLRQVVAVTNASFGDNTLELGRYLVLAGEYEEGKQLLEPFLEGQFRTNNPWYYQVALYHLGRANEDLGLTQEAIDKYSEYLKYWGDADIQIEPIIDAKERLARLTA